MPGHKGFITLGLELTLINIYTDFRKAFDLVPHKRLAYKLELYSISGGLLRWVNDFLDSRQQRVVCGGSKSDWSHVTSGVLFCSYQGWGNRNRNRIRL